MPAKAIAGFRFRDELRPHVQHLGELIIFSNGTPGHYWALQNSNAEGPKNNGVYGLAYWTLEKIIRLECGDEVLNIIRRFTSGMNFGGNEDYAADVEVAITEALAIIEQRRLQDPQSMLMEAEDCLQLHDFAECLLHVAEYYEHRACVGANITWQEINHDENVMVDKDGDSIAKEILLRAGELANELKS